MKHTFIINPAAGKKKNLQTLVERIETACKQADLDYEVIFTECAGDGVRLTRSLADAGKPCRVYACGGDGTLNEIVQGAAGVEHMAVTNVPTGTGNDFLKMFGPTFRERFSDIAALSEGPQEPLDLMDCNRMLGLDIICAGVDARVADDVHRYNALPLVKGKGSYVLSLINNVIFKDIARPMKVSMGDLEWDDPVTILCICNGRYYGGGFMPVGDALPDDGILDCLLVPQVNRVTFAKLVGDYSKGLYAKYPELIRHHHGPGPIVFSAHEDITLCVDGEIVKGKEFSVALSEKKLNFFHPADVFWSLPQTAEEAAEVPAVTP